jgi:hypothetical protein
MKPTLRALPIAFAILLGISSCKKSQSQTATRDRYGIGIDWPKLDTDFRDTDPNVQAAVSAIKRSILYHQFPQAIADLERLASNSTLSDSQKKVLTELRNQTQQVMAKASSPQPAQ